MGHATSACDLHTIARLDGKVHVEYVEFRPDRNPSSTELQSNLFRTNIKGPMIFVRNNGSSSSPYVFPSEYTGFYPIQLRILVLLRQTFVLSVFFLTRFHCSSERHLYGVAAMLLKIRTRFFSVRLERSKYT